MKRKFNTEHNMSHIEGETRGVGGRKPNEVKYSKSEEGHYIGYVIHNNVPLEFLIDEDDIERVKTRNWHAVTGGSYIGATVCVDGKKKVLYLHNFVMNRLTFPGKGSIETVDHINRNGLDNRKSNLRVVSQSIQNTNQKKRERRAELPEGISELPKHVWYIKPNGLHGDRFCIELKTEGVTWKTTSSKKVTIHEKLQQAKDKIEELYGQYPHLKPSV